MHGRPRDYKHKLRDPRAQEGYKRKVCTTASTQQGLHPRPGMNNFGTHHISNQQVDAIRHGTALVLECRKQGRYDEAAMDAAGKLLKVVPEVRTSGTSQANTSVYTGPVLGQASSSDT